MDGELFFATTVFATTTVLSAAYAAPTLAPAGVIDQDFNHAK